MVPDAAIVTAYSLAGPQHRNRTVNPCGLVKGLSLGPAREYAVTIAASGTTDHVLNFVPMIMNY